MSKSFEKVLTEAIVVGILFIVLFYAIEKVFPKFHKFIKLFVTASLFHIICEYTGINIWYVKDYNKYLQ
jgi:hypothetical protein